MALVLPDKTSGSSAAKNRRSTDLVHRASNIPSTFSEMSCFDAVRGQASAREKAEQASSTLAAGAGEIKDLEGKIKALARSVQLAALILGHASMRDPIELVLFFFHNTVCCSQ